MKLDDYKSLLKFKILLVVFGSNVRTIIENLK